LLGDLAGLPPILVQASEIEILRDDGRRYVNKAIASGVDATLQLWAKMPHVWQIFHPDLPEADQAFNEIKAFIESHS
jgi:acetyl esterase/lipase